ncbi:hypothetical protein C7999DRAFT_14416 [Corynascus novoguineensis]|uniref:Clr5 domain-containing protein n=1 Tax=Corynascus novoguineensis TaxID=1126955 RepID=A0AAN7HJ46_9PEZI|nr:hypothetical protein C7999DRAFT_14416 [Corynascus novoguineensis]
MNRISQTEGEARALLATAESLTGLVLDDHDPRIFIKEESKSPSPDSDRSLPVPPLITTSVSPPQKLSSVSARKASTTQHRSSRHGAKVGTSRASQLRGPPSPGQPIVPRKNQDWEPWKGILYELYITQNRILRDIINIMETKHNLRATSKMYKNQLARWGFFKYAIKGRSRAKAESPNDQSSDDSLDNALILSRDDLLHANNGSRSVQAGLTAVRRFIHGHIDLDPSNLQVEEVAGFVDPCYRYFKVAMDLFDLKENVEGGRVLRLAFLQIERKISKPTLKSFSDLCFLVPHLLLESNRRDILSAYVHYVSRLAAVKFGKHPVSELAASFAALVDERPEDIMRFIILLSQFNADTIASLPGMLDRNTEWARNQYLACKRTASQRRWLAPSPWDNDSSSSGGGGSVDDDDDGGERHDHRMIRLEAQSVYWAQKLIMHDPVSDEIATQWLQKRFSVDYAPKCEAYLAQLKEMVATGGLPVVFARMMESLCVGWLHDYYETIGDWDKAFEWGRRGLQLSSDEQYSIWSVHLENMMRRHGRPEEAEELRRKRREHSWLERVRLEVDRLVLS